ncbi:MAG: S8 family serine peptidase [Actinomycetota bacterium]|nr:S8 family serine peptidase [Actinomycetota bacterium]
MGSLYTIAKRYGAQDAWGKSGGDGRKILGTGVDVAVIDTGVSPVAGLSDPTRVVNGPDLSFESQAPNMRHLDGYGHGTHMSAIIAGRDADVPAGGGDDAKHFVGVAPGARIVNLKVKIRVINFSYGTGSTQPYAIDPLAHAVENAWRHGIVVVTAAGNSGLRAALTMPAADPYVIAVGAVDHVGTKTFDDDRVADFTNTGTSIRRPDLLAPGKSVVSLRTPGSYADRSHPEGLVSGDSHVVDPLNGAVLTGEVDALGQAWDARSWSAASSAGEAWSGGTWNARSWSQEAWAGRTWHDITWGASDVW